MIQVKKIECQTAEHFDPEGNSLGFLNQHEHYDLRCQIKENEAVGYYVMFEELRLDISSDGGFNPDKGLYDTDENLLYYLVLNKKRT